MTLDEGLYEAIKRDWHSAKPYLSEPEIAMLTYVEKLTLKPYTITPEDLDALRNVGFDDTGITQINLIASWFNYINRVADGLGIGKGSPDTGIL